VVLVHIVKYATDRSGKVILTYPIAFVKTTHEKEWGQKVFVLAFAFLRLIAHSFVIWTTGPWRWRSHSAFTVVDRAISIAIEFCERSIGGSLELIVIECAVPVRVYGFQPVAFRWTPVLRPHLTRHSWIAAWGTRPAVGAWRTLGRDRSCDD
jgi:hypothetical protein